jgi:hypothetical protein
VTIQLKGAYIRIQCLDKPVDLSPSTFVQYQSLEAKKLWKEFTTEEEKNRVEEHSFSLEIDKSEFFDAYENLPVYREEFFDCLEKCESENYDDCARRDLLDLDGAYHARVVVECCGTSTSQHSTSGLHESPSTETTVLESNLAPSELALSELIGNMVICPVVNNATSQWIMTVIFDTGASLAITPELSDFVSPPKLLARPMKLGGMANVIEMKGIGIIAWTFTAKYGTEVQIRTEAYYIPEAKQILLSPQRLLHKKKGIFGPYSGDEDKFELKLNDNPIMSVPYESRSVLPISEVIVGPEPEPTVNLTILEPGNQNLTGGQKLLLEWHYRFCHLNFQSLQNVLRRAPFVAKRFSAAMKCDLPRSEICELAKAKRRKNIYETKNKNPERDGALKVNNLSPGTRVSVYHFECRQRGKTCDL